MSDGAKEDPTAPLDSVADAVKIVGLTAHMLRTHGRNLRTGVRYPAHLTPDLEKVADGLSRAFVTLTNHHGGSSG